MESKAVYLKIPKTLYSDITKIKKALGFQNIQEFLRDAARKAVAEYELQMSIRRIKRLQGSSSEPRKDQKKVKIPPEQSSGALI